MTKDEESSENSLPTGWVWSTLSELSWDSDYGTSQKCEYTADGPPVLRIPNIAAGQLDLSDLKYALDGSPLGDNAALVPGDLLIVRTNGSKSLIGRGAVVKRDLVPNHFFASYLIRFRLQNYGSLPAYISTIWHSPYVREWVERTAATSAGQYNISLGALSGLRLPVPPAVEQQRIIARVEDLLSQIDAGITGLRDVQAKLKRYRAAVLKGACEGTLVPTEAELARAENRDYEPADVLLQCILTERRARWEAEQLAKMKAAGKEPKDSGWKVRYEEPPRPDISPLSGLPEGWEWVTVGQISTKVVDGTHHTPDYKPTGVPFISVKDVRQGRIWFDECKYVAPNDHMELIKRCHPEPEDILITKSGTIGRTAVVLTEREFSLFVSVALIKTIKGEFLPSYIRLALDYYIQGISISQHVKGGLIKNLHLEDLRVVPLRLAPLAEQERIVAEVERRLSVVEQTEAAIAANLKRAERLRQAILRDAFAGKLVPQDPNDEPASVLLERIRAERAATAKQTAKAERGGKGRRTVKRSGTVEGQEMLPLAEETE